MSDEPSDLGSGDDASHLMPADDAGIELGLELNTLLDDLSLSSSSFSGDDTAMSHFPSLSEEFNRSIILNAQHRPSFEMPDAVSAATAAAAIALPEQTRPRIIYDPQRPLLAEGDPQRALSAEVDSSDSESISGSGSGSGNESRDSDSNDASSDDGSSSTKEDNDDNSSSDEETVDDGSSSDEDSAVAAIALPEQIRPRIIYDPQHPLLAEKDTQRALLAEGDPQRALLADCDPQRALLAECDPQRALLTEGNPQRALLAENDPQRPLLAEGDPQRPLPAEVNSSGSESGSGSESDSSDASSDDNDSSSDDGSSSNKEDNDDNSSSDEETVDNGSSSDDGSSSDEDSAVAAIALPEQIRPRIIYDPQHPLLAENYTQRALLAEGDPQRALLAEGDPQRALLAEGDPQRALLAEGDPQRALLAEGDSQRGLLAEGDPKRPLLAENDPQRSLLAEGDPQRPLPAEVNSSGSESGSGSDSDSSDASSDDNDSSSDDGSSSNKEDNDDNSSSDEETVDNGSSSHGDSDDGQPSPVKVVCASDLPNVDPNFNIADEDLGGEEECEEMQMESEVQEPVVEQEEFEQGVHQEEEEDEEQEEGKELMEGVEQDAGEEQTETENDSETESEQQSESEEELEDQVEEQLQQQIGQEQNPGVCGNVEIQMEVEARVPMAVQDQEVLEELVRLVQAIDMKVDQKPMPITVPMPEIDAESTASFDLNEDVYSQGSDEEVVSSSSRSSDGGESEDSVQTVIRRVPREAETGIEKETETVKATEKATDAEKEIEKEMEKKIEPQGATAGGGANKKIVVNTGEIYYIRRHDGKVQAGHVLKSRNCCFEYYVHYLGVNRSLDEWVPFFSISKNPDMPVSRWIPDTKKKIKPQGARGEAIKKEKRDRFWYIQNVKTNTDKIYYIRRHDGKVHAGHILESRDWGSEYYVHYLGFNRRLDEWVPFKLISDNPDDLGGTLQPVARSNPSAHEQAQKLPDNSNIQYIIFTDDNFKMSRCQRSQLELKMNASDAAVEKEHARITKVKYIDKVVFGNFEIGTWYFSPYPDEFGKARILYICEFCLKYMRKIESYRYHLHDCKKRTPPGDVVYRKGNLLIYEVMGNKQKLYCQLLCLMAKLFLDHKSLFYDMEPFDFYILCETDKQRRSHFLGYFAKEKESQEFNLACLLVLPPHQRKGYGKLLIAFSYELARKDGFIGTPEKPLSIMGFRGYRSFWGYTLLKLMKSRYHLKEDIDIAEMSELTFIAKDDIRKTLESLNMMKYYSGKHTINVTLQMINAKLMSPQLRRPKLTIDVKCIHWKKPKPPRIPSANLVICPPPAAAASPCPTDDAAPTAAPPSTASAAAHVAAMPKDPL